MFSAILILYVLLIVIMTAAFILSKKYALSIEADLEELFSNQAVDKKHYAYLRKTVAQHNICPICGMFVRRKNNLTVCRATGKLHPDIHPWSAT